MSALLVGTSEKDFPTNYDALQDSTNAMREELSYLQHRWLSTTCHRKSVLHYRSIRQAPVGT